MAGVEKVYEVASRACSKARVSGAQRERVSRDVAQEVALLVDRELEAIVNDESRKLYVCYEFIYAVVKYMINKDITSHGLKIGETSIMA
jgi:hypothetical protein